MTKKKFLPRSLKQEINYQNKLVANKERLKIKERDKQKEKAWFLVWAVGFAGRKTYTDFTVFITFEKGKTKKEMMDMLEKDYRERGFDFVRKT